ncbi:hypothetical protein [Kordiimonas sp. SCSIO 12610]|uniref:WD40/YVTN/BNR-like repeat-containing protein n=1 Tax=Kordiimonas sp. SCSIO 12610 TaxID=2829597 RepID=UPI00210B4303|nr:hypothetical protein [Kordiimonas sp. SCSIO 12610]UTW53928.1 hypothetical protein KFF44_08720 [Kordiimonas sp. SCSIO 12610]
MSKTFKGRFTSITATMIACGFMISLPQSGAIADTVDDKLLQALEYRNIGPFRGGRATAVAGIASDPSTYYIGTVGGVWKTTDGGQNWNVISDDDFKTASVGAIAVAPSDKNVVVVGMGESPYRGVASSHGDGVYISTDGGENFKNVGLKDSRQISTIQIDPNDPETIYVAVQGSPWAPTKERGVYKTTDGGKTWSQTLFVNETSSAIDLSVDPNNPRILYASMWDNQRKPWEIRSGGEGSGIWKSVDGGDTWKKMSKGLPDEMGKIGVVAAPAKSGRVWAIVEAKKKGGLYKSDDFGESWSHVNGTRGLHARSWYYMHVFADPQDADTVYVQNSAFFKSIDGGKTFPTRITGTHGDYHDLWINPNNPDMMGVANDGGGAVSWNGGKTWSTQMNQPTAQFYRVNADNDFFYRVYAGQQDNSTVAIRSRGLDGGIGIEDFKPVGGCESGHVSFDPDNPRFVYAGCYLGQINEYDDETVSSRDIRVYPEIGFGIAPKDRKYRFNWNAPIHVSTHDTKVIYHAGNRLFRSSDRGQSWTVVSPDLSKNDPDTLGDGGRPITNEVSENYGTIFALAEHGKDANTLWAGTDDGLVQVTTDGGASWNNVTPKRAGNGLVNSIDLSVHDDSTAYVAFTRYKYNDHTPLIFKTTNNGKSWKNIAKGIPDGHFVRVVREDPVRKGLLYAGTEVGMYVSFNDGDDWQPMQSNLPVIPVTDIKVHKNDLVLSTQGRAFWIMDDISPLRTMGGDVPTEATLFAPSTAYDVQYYGRSNSRQAPNPDRGAVFYYSLPESFDHKETALTVEIVDSDGNVIRTLKSDKKGNAKGGGSGTRYKLPAKAGLNKAVWDLNEDARPGVKGAWSPAWGNRDEFSGPGALPGSYTLRLKAGDTISEQPLTLMFDPRHNISDSDWAEKRELMKNVDGIFTELATTLATFKDVRGQLKGQLKFVGDKDLKKQGEAILKSMQEWEDGVFSSKRTFFQDVLNWPDRLVSELSGLYGGIDGAVPPLTGGIKERYSDLSSKWEMAKAKRDELIANEIAAFNKAFKEKEDVINLSKIAQ